MSLLQLDGDMASPTPGRVPKLEHHCKVVRKSSDAPNLGASHGYEVRGCQEVLSSKFPVIRFIRRSRTRIV